VFIAVSVNVYIRVIFKKIMATLRLKKDMTDKSYELRKLYFVSHISLNDV
jgi:hypothetical protein